jgi:hypothetical protein
MPVTINGTSGITGNSGTVISASTIGVGGATPSASGAGITFPATQSASSNANTLDDYEEGSFTPTVTAASGSNGGGSFDGAYIKVGRYVFVTLRCIGISKGTLSGQIAVGNLPFPVNTINTSGVCRYELNASPAAGTTIIIPQSGGGTGLELQMFNGGGYLGNVSTGNLGSNFSFYNITYSYITDN